MQQTNIFINTTMKNDHKEKETDVINQHWHKENKLMQQCKMIIKKQKCYQENKLIQLSKMIIKRKKLMELINMAKKRIN